MANYNPTCIYTGKKENLVMKAHRNENGDMVGWIFVHQDYFDADSLEIEWRLTDTKEKDANGIINRVKIDNL